MNSYVRLAVIAGLVAGLTNAGANLVIDHVKQVNKDLERQEAEEHYRKTMREFRETTQQ